LDGIDPPAPPGPDGRRVTTVKGTDASEQHRDGERWPNPAGANARSVWTIATEPTPFAHFATWPQKLVGRMIQAGTSERGCCPVCGAPWVRETESAGGGANHQGARAAIDPAKFGAMLQQHRERKGLTRRQVAGHFLSKTGGVTGIIWNWENGLAPPSPSEWPKLRDLLGIGPDYDHLFVVQEATTDGWRENERGALVSGKSGLAGGADTAKRIRTTAWLQTCDHNTEPAPCSVLDPFAGSGTTMLVARKHGRHAIGIELNAGYCEIAAERLAQQSLLAEGCA
jgi:hypothetical protein